jgi:hypothetical protein
MIQDEKEYFIEKINEWIKLCNFSEKEIEVILQIREKLKSAKTKKEFYDAIVGFLFFFKE